ncbi:MAG: BamA/TamA family outer membrane protein [Gammaproteobacteria bacterium]|nr:BamA/TamA family outer membrane protein [Gammaproteobacteria bacterium]
MNHINWLVYSFLFFVLAGPAPILAANSKTSLPEFAEFANHQVDKENVLPRVSVNKKSKQIEEKEKLFVMQIAFEGEAIIPKADFERLTTNYQQRIVTIEELYTLRAQLNRYLVAKGYINSQIIIPDQKIENGIVRYALKPGELSAIELNGNKKLSKADIERGVLPYVSKPLNINQLASVIHNLELLPEVDKVNAQIYPSNLPTRAVLSLNVDETKDWQLYTGINNHRSSNIGQDRYYLGGSYEQLFTSSDHVAMDLGLTEGIKELSFAYRYGKLFSAANDLSMFYTRSDAAIIDAAFRDLHIESVSRSYGLKLDRKLNFGGAQRWSSHLQLDARSSRQQFLDRAESLDTTRGAEQGLSKSVNLQIGLQWLRSSERWIVQMAGQMRQGFKLMDASQNDGQVNGQYSSFNSQLLMAWRLPFWRSQLRFRSMAQYTSKRVLAVETFAVGGANSVRGYEENTFVRDNGLISSMEWHVPVALKILSRSRQSLNWLMFADYARVLDHDVALTRESYRAQSLSSVGLGLNWKAWRRLYAEFSVAMPLVKQDLYQQEIPTNYFHFNLRYQIN